MAKVITLGETMICFSPDTMAPLRYARSFHPRIAGAESNLAVGLAKLGHKVSWISRLGADEFGHYVQNMIRSEGVDTQNVFFDEKNPTGIMFKEITQGETRVYYYRKNSAASTMQPEDLDESLFEEADLLHLTGITPALSEHCFRTMEHAMELAGKHGVTISFDPNIRRKLWEDRDFIPLLRNLCDRSNILLMGLDEAQLLYGEMKPEGIFQAVFSQSSVQLAVLKDGANGAWAGQQGCIVFVKPVPCRCIDPVGAGDAFNAAFLSGVLEGRDLETSARMGAVSGAMATETDGDTEGYPDRKELERILNNQREIYR